MFRKLIIGWILPAVLFAWSGPADASEIVRRLGMTVFSALEVGQGARAAAMGNAFTSVANDVNAIWWNPAGLSDVERAEVSFTHTQWFVNSQFNSGALAYNRGVHSFAVNFLSFRPEELEERTIYKPLGTGRMLDLGTVGVGAAYARKFTDKLSFGVRVMWLKESLDLVDYSTLSVDFGTKFYIGFRSLRLSMSMRNFGRDLMVYRREFQQPLSFNLGSAAEVYGEKGDPFFLTGAFEMNFTVNAYERYHLGGEAWLANMLALRAGYMWNYDLFSTTAGAGIRIPYGPRYLTADIAWQQTKSEHHFDAPIRFSLSIGL